MLWWLTLDVNLTRSRITLRAQPVGLSVKDSLDWVHWCGRIHLTSGQDHSIGWSLKGEEEKASWALAFSLLPLCLPCLDGSVIRFELGAKITLFLSWFLFPRNCIPVTEKWDWPPRIHCAAPIALHIQEPYNLHFAKISFHWPSLSPHLSL